MTLVRRGGASTHWTTNVVAVASCYSVRGAPHLGEVLHFTYCADDRADEALWVSQGQDQRHCCVLSCADGYQSQEKESDRYHRRSGAGNEPGFAGW